MTYVLQKAPYMVDFLTLLGYCLMDKSCFISTDDIEESTNFVWTASTPP